MYVCVYIYIYIHTHTHTHTHTHSCGDSPKALAHIDEALAYTPTVIDLHLTKARILKHAGDLAGAADECETARKMDLADRFLNTMSTRFASACLAAKNIHACLDHVRCCQRMSPAVTAMLTAMSTCLP